MRYSRDIPRYTTRRCCRISIDVTNYETDTGRSWRETLRKQLYATRTCRMSGFVWHKARSENASQRQVTVRGSFPAKLCLFYQINNVPNNKCKCPWLGSLRGRSDLPVAIDWSCDMIKVLGIFIGFGDIGCQLESSHRRCLESFDFLEDALAVV